MLTDDQITDLWERRINAEVRSLYFADLANTFSTRKQWITGLSFFLSSGAAATLIGKGPVWLPIALSTLVAGMTAYSLAVSLDRKIRTISKLQSSWGKLSVQYRRLWNRTWAEEAGSELDGCIQEEVDLSELVATEAPNDQKRIAKWHKMVFNLYQLESA